MTRFAEAQDLRTLLDGTTLDETDDAEWIAQVELLLDLISADIQTAARNRIIRETRTVKLAGTWSADLELPARPVVSVDSVTLNGNPLAAGSFTWNERALLRSSIPSIANLGPTELDPYDGAHWGGPASTVEVVYAVGYEAADVPVSVKALALRVASRTLDNLGGVSQESLGPYSVSYGNVLDAGGSYLTDKERKLLRRRFSTTAGTNRARSI